MNERKLDVIAVNRGDQLAMLDNGELIPVKHWLDRDGEFCEPDDAVACVAGKNGLGWWAIDLDQFTGRAH